MKLNIEVDIDWLEDDGSIDDMVQHEIILGVKQAISKGCLALVEKKTQKAIDDGLKSAINLMNDKVSTFFEEWLNTEAVITDKYGDKKEEGSLKDIIKRQFSDCINERVDKDGRVGGYGSTYTRMEFLTGKKVQLIVDEHLSNYGKNINKTIKDTIEKGIKSRVSDKFAEMVIGYAKQDADNAKAINHQS